ncbi:1,2-phenylacetyl-CoA epoxidase subunit PaaD [Henriciella mobilis]|uniref:Phenylacetate-CoA oxygenase subunit PaaJ n=1 Tax=Henriciella mobilis TaxID=2305467 RepID=A0A399RSC7_9PROT|nr:1,2-phenylacetyl-CoA epoxidase subunit PaaD [Henriciella mobilis]RIJ33174.1 phenylacetate-CoA oxygenase subunit PaaJ [Henriciella mobilis]
MGLLSSVPDPEIPALSVVELGIVRAVHLDPPEVHITPTYSGCPATLAIEAAIRRCLDDHGLESFSIRTVLSPAWTTDWITTEGRQKLRAYGIAPPDPGKPVACPQCGSTHTEEVSRFGSTPCKAQWRCLECLEPFDRFKCH